MSGDEKKSDGTYFCYFLPDSAVSINPPNTPWGDYVETGIVKGNTVQEFRVNAERELTFLRMCYVISKSNIHLSLSFKNKDIVPAGSVINVSDINLDVS